MKIEKVNNDRLKITLTISDLREQDIDIADLSFDTPKAHTFFDEILSRAFDEFGFEINDAPVIIEASPVSKDTLVIFISKVDRETVLNRLKAHTEKLEDVSKSLELTNGTMKLPAPAEGNKRKRRSKSEPLIYSSSTLDNIENACLNLSGLFEGQSMLYSFKEMYYLVLGKNRIKGVSFAKIEAVLSEYMSKVKTSVLTLAYLDEHSKVILKTRAVEQMASY